jgi:murein DD-endopeptidase MepM/ murein hydrolase activator NlpD
LGDRAYPVVGGGLAGWAFLPFDALAQPGRQPLALAGAPMIAGARPFSVTLQAPILAGDYGRDDVPADTADPILAEAQKVAEEAKKVTAAFARESPFGWLPSSRFRSPLPVEGLHTSPFGTRRVYGSSGGLTYHAGEDFGVAAGTPVLAPAAGVVALAEPLFVRGNAVIVDHGHGVVTGYWHMQKLNVKAGDRVAAGDQLGEVGTTGLSTGPHLHWELRVHGVAVDPLEWLR